jgi:hypothetical protein
MNTAIAVSNAPFTDAEQTAIREQLERVLASPHFNHSKRYPAFLHYIVEETLAGRTDDVKERTIGIQIFHRSADYETNTDPIVRVTAGAIRRRLSQYYLEPGHEDQLQIELPPGTYVPSFHFPAPKTSGLLALPKSRAGQRVNGETGLTTRKWNGTPRWLRYAAAVALAAVLISSSFMYKQQAANNPVNQFWYPLTASKQTLLLCVANARENDFGENVSLPDMLTLSGVQNTLKSRNRSYRVVDISTTDPSKVSDSPTVFVVPYHNPWAMQLTRNLRYSFEVNSNPTPQPGQPRAIGVIKDSFSQAEWRNQLTGARETNYALVARFHDPSLGRDVVLISGLTPAATTAAGQLLTDPRLTDLLASHAPADWQKMNLEAVVRTQADNHLPGPPEIEATYFWQ